MLDVHKQLPLVERPKINVLDKEVSAKMAYSSIVVSLAAGKVVNYYIILLEGTGRESLTAADIMGEVQNAVRSSGQLPFIYTTDDAIDEVLHGEVKRVLAVEYGGDMDFISTDGLVVPAVQHDVKNIAIRISSIAFNACRSEKAMLEGTAKDLNIAAAKNASPQTVLKLESNLLKQVTANEVDAPVRADWIVELNAINTNNNVTSLNLQNAKQTLVRTSGFIDAIPEQITVPTMPGMPAMVNLRLHPHIVINNNSVHTPTIGYSLLGIISSLVMTNPNMWLAAVMPKEGKGIRNTGALNILTNLENNKSHIGEILDLTNKKTTADEAYALLKQMFSLSPIVSYDIESFGPQTHYSSIYALAAEPGNSIAKNNAGRQIVKSANWLTNGAFPDDFRVDRIFSNNGIMVPMGKWSDKSGERDIRDIDTAFIATQTSDTSLINKWVLSSLPKEVTGMDPYLTKVDIIAKLIPSAVITGKAIRVTFTGEFISLLTNAAMAAGLNARYEPKIEFAETNNLSVMGSYINAAGINNAAGFATQQAASGPVFNTNYSHAGHGRW